MVVVSVGELCGSEGECCGCSVGDVGECVRDVFLLLICEWGVI